MKEKESAILIRRLFLSLLPIQALAIGLPAAITPTCNIFSGSESAIWENEDKNMAKLVFYDVDGTYPYERIF